MYCSNRLGNWVLQWCIPGRTYGALYKVQAYKAEIPHLDGKVERLFLSDEAEFYKIIDKSDLYLNWVKGFCFE